MPRSKKNPDSPPDELQLENEEESKRPHRATGAYIPLTPDGLLDESRIKYPDRVEAARRALGLSSSAAPSDQPYLKPSSITVDPNFVRGLYRGIEVSLQWVGSRFLKWPHDLAAQMRYSDEQKDRLIPPTKQVIEELAPQWLVKHQSIATLAVIFAAETQTMVETALRSYVAAHPELIPKPAAAPVKPNGSTTEDHIAGDALAQSA